MRLASCLSFPVIARDRFLEWRFRSHRLSIDEFQGELNLSRGARGLADNPKPAAVHNVGRQSKIHDIEDVEELRTEFDGSQFRVAAASKGRVLDESDIEVMVRGAAKR